MTIVLTRATKQAARYTAAGGAERCSLCRFFMPQGTCGRIIGPVSPRGWCKYYSREMTQRFQPGAIPAGGGAPSLDLSFTTGTLDPRITFTRAAGPATYFDAAGVLQTAGTNVARFDYDPVTHAPLGLLIEEARTNLLLNSATLGTQSVAVTAQAYTLSFYGTGTITKSGTSTGALVGTGAFPTRVSQTFTPTAGTLTCTVTGSVLNANLEAGTFATSYITTSGAAATRAADVATMPIGAAWNAAASTLVADALIPFLSGATFTFVTVDDGVATNRLALRTVSTVTNCFYLVASVTTATATIGAVAAGVPFKAGAALLPGSFSGSVNGGAVVSASGAEPTGVTLLRFGSSNATNAQLNGWLSRARYWPRALSATELQQVTT